jgi:hypothetical protein
MMLLVATLASCCLMASSVSRETSPAKSPLLLPPVPQTTPTSTTSHPQRRRSFAAASLRRARAIALGYFQPKPSSPDKAFIEVPKPLRLQIKHMVTGRILKATRENQLGHPTHSTRLAALAAHRACITSPDEFRKDTKIIRRQNAANHGSLRIPWADMKDEAEEIVTNKTLTSILDKWWESKSPFPAPNLPISSSPIGPSFAPRLDQPRIRPLCRADPPATRATDQPPAAK